MWQLEEEESCEFNCLTNIIEREADGRFIAVAEVYRKDGRNFYASVRCCPSG